MELGVDAARSGPAGSSRSARRAPSTRRFPRDLGPPPPSPLRPSVVRAVREQVVAGVYHPEAEAVAARLLALIGSGDGRRGLRARAGS